MISDGYFTPQRAAALPRYLMRCATDATPRCRHIDDCRRHFKRRASTRFHTGSATELSMRHDYDDERASSAPLHFLSPPHMPVPRLTLHIIKIAAWPIRAIPVARADADYYLRFLIRAALQFHIALTLAALMPIYAR